MPTYPLIIDNQARALISVSMAHAMRSPVSHAALVEISEMAKKNPVGGLVLNRDHTVPIPACYTATYTVEEQMPGVLFRHLSVAIIDGQPDRGPHPLVMDEIMREYGFHNDRENVQGWLETLEDGRLAVNVLEPLDGDWSRCAPNLRGSTGTPEVVPESSYA